MLICGDFNLNKISWNPDPSNPTLPPSSAQDSPESKFLECFQDCFLSQHVTEPTRYRKGIRDEKPTLDDLIITKSENDVGTLSYDPSIGLSDHITLNFTLNWSSIPKPEKRSIYLYDKGDYDKMQNMINNVDWNTELEGKSVEEALHSLETVYHNAVKECIPMKEVGSESRFKPLWMNANALRKVKRKHSSWVRYLNTKQGQDFLEYKNRRNEANHAIKEARKEFEKTLAKNCRKNPKGVWHYIKSQRKTKTLIPNLLKADGSSTTTDEEITEVLNQQFFSVFTREDIANKPTIPRKDLITDDLISINIQREEVEKLLKALNPKKAPGLDNFHPTILKNTAQAISHPITKIFQISFESSELPTKWLQALVVPLFKKGSRSVASNYRPVSLTSILCKTLEKIVVRHIIQHLKSNNLQAKQQHGFTPKKSITTNLLEALNVWTEALMHNIPVDVLYLDYAKAFDTVPHQRLIDQVASFGIGGKVLSWIKAFLSNRQQKVKANGKESSWSPVISGIPQGSIMGPILFTIFVNDIPQKVSSIISMYADDTKLYLPLVHEDATDIIADDLESLQEWASKMQMQFHPSKCKVIHFGNNNPDREYTMHKTDGTLHVIEEDVIEKDLGVEVDFMLNFHYHIQQKINKANKVLGCLRHSFKYLDKDSFTMLYKSIVRPHLEFASCIWNPKTKRYIDMIERVQRRATKMVQGIKDLPYTDRLKELKLETLEYRRMRSDLIETFRILNGIHELDRNCYCSVCPDKYLLQPSLAQQTRGHQMKLQIQDATNARQNFFENRVSQLWNTLSNETVTSKNVNIFKGNLDKDLGHQKYLFKFSY